MSTRDYRTGSNPGRSRWPHNSKLQCAPNLQYGWYGSGACNQIEINQWRDRNCSYWSLRGSDHSDDDFGARGESLDRVGNTRKNARPTHECSYDGVGEKY